MKKIFLALALAVMTIGSAFAQDDNQKQGRPDPAKMAEHMTEQMVKKYGLDDKQKASLLELNKEYAGKMPMMGRRGGPGMRGGRPGGMRPDSTMQQRPDGPAPEMNGQQNPPQMNGGQPGGPDMKNGQRPSKEEMEKMRKEMETNREAYNKGLKKIMTDDQYKKYTEDQQKRQQRGPRENKQ